MPKPHKESERDLQQVVVTLTECSNQADVSKLLSRGFSMFLIRADRHNSTESKRLIDLLKHAKRVVDQQIAVIVQLDGRQLPRAKVIDSASLYLYPSSLPLDLKQQILLVQSEEVEYVCLQATINIESQLSLKSCLVACGASAELLVRFEADASLQQITSLLDVADGALISAEDFASHNNPLDVGAGHKTIVKLCRQCGTPVYVCLRAIDQS